MNYFDFFLKNATPYETIKILTRKILKIPLSIIKGDNVKIKKTFIHFICLFVWNKQKRALIRQKFLNTNTYPVLIDENARFYKEIKLPIYNQSAKLCGEEPEIFNKNGDRLKVIFIRDAQMAAGSAQASNFIYWDKYNFELPMHFYTHNTMLETMGSPTNRFGALIETRGVHPNDYQIFQKNKGLEKDFDLIFTYDEELLNSLSNARFVPFCADVKLFKRHFNSLPNLENIFDTNLFFGKSNNISILSSNKKMCDLHIKRVETAFRLKQLNCVDTYGTFDGGMTVDPYDTLKDYRYSVIFENEISAYCFTEKLTNCFATQTVPIYIGASKINEFFDVDGIIQINYNDIDTIEKVIAQCSEQDYLSRKNAIMNNFQKVQLYANNLDLMYNTYIKNYY